MGHRLLTVVFYTEMTHEIDQHVFYTITKQR